jgi:beta-galactosidase/beta-glucuronidase
MKYIPRSEYPRPQFVRADWLNLNGTWAFEIDNGMSGRARGLPDAAGLSGEIEVPFCPESSLSRVTNTDFMNCVWYRHTYLPPADWAVDGRRTLLHIGACDYETEVWINGKSVGKHRGGYVSFSFDITEALRAGENIITICAEDNTRDPLQPTGKQSTKYESYGCLYTRTTGIWQNVWLENTPDTYIANARYTPLPDQSALLIEAECQNADGKALNAAAVFGGKAQGAATCVVAGGRAVMTLILDELHLWDIGSPNLYDLTLTLGDDKVDSYFGMRTATAENGCLYLNGRPVFQRLILDQGFYPDGIYTAPDDEDLKKDIRLSMDMGFNGARLHEKVFEPRFLSHCDRMGYIVWGEYPNWGMDISQPGAWRNFLPEWIEAVRRDYNHPAIIGWCPFNETQKDQDAALLETAAAVTRLYDRTRPLIDTSGYFHVGELSDFICAHNYEQDPAKFSAHFDKLADGPITCIHSGVTARYTFVSEYGGIWWSEDDPDGWGYGQRPASLEEVIERFRGLTEALIRNPEIHAICYTQLTDVEQEQNGLYTYKRVPKMDAKVIRAILKQRE